MADNTQLNTGTGGDIISTDVITTLNGGGIATGEKAQRVKAGWGVDGTFNDTSASNPLPVVQTGTPALPTGAATNAVLTGGTQVTKIVDSAGTNQLNIDSSGYVGIQSGGTPGSASPARALQIGGTDGTNLRAVKVDTAGNLFANVVAVATGGYTPSKLISAATTNATVIKASAGTLGYLTASNINAAPRYLKIYDKASSPTVGTDVPVHTFLIPGNTAGAGTNIPIPSEGIKLASGISLAITALATDADATAVAANEIIINYGTI